MPVGRARRRSVFGEKHGRARKCTYNTVWSRVATQTTREHLAGPQKYDAEL